MKTPKQKLQAENNELWKQVCLNRYGDRCLLTGVSPITFHHFYAKGSYGHMIYEIENGVPLSQSLHYSLHFTNRRTQIEEEIKRARGKEWSDEMYAMSKEKHSSFKTLKWLQKENKKLKDLL